MNRLFSYQKIVKIWKLSAQLNKLINTELIELQHNLHITKIHCDDVKMYLRFIVTRHCITAQRFEMF